MLVVVRREAARGCVRSSRRLDKIDEVPIQLVPERLYLLVTHNVVYDMQWFARSISPLTMTIVAASHLPSTQPNEINSIISSTNVRSRRNQEASPRCRAAHYRQANSCGIRCGSPR